jgi:hypothetical protein
MRFLPVVTKDGKRVALNLNLVVSIEETQYSQPPNKGKSKLIFKHVDGTCTVVASCLIDIRKNIF